MTTAGGAEALMSVTYDVVAGDFVRGGEAAGKLKRVLQQLGLDPMAVRLV